MIASRCSSTTTQSRQRAQRTDVAHAWISGLFVSLHGIYQIVPVETNFIVKLRLHTNRVFCMHIALHVFTQDQVFSFMDFESTSHAANEAAYLPLKLLFKITYWKRHQELVFRIMVFILQHYAQWPREPRRTDYLHDWYVYPVTDLCMSYVCIVELNKRSSN